MDLKPYHRMSTKKPTEVEKILLQDLSYIKGVWFSVHDNEHNDGQSKWAYSVLFFGHFPYK